MKCERCVYPPEASTVDFSFGCGVPLVANVCVPCQREITARLLTLPVFKTLKIVEQKLSFMRQICGAGATEVYRDNAMENLICERVDLANAVLAIITEELVTPRAKEKASKERKATTVHDEAVTA